MKRFLSLLLTLLLCLSFIVSCEKEETPSSSSSEPTQESSSSGLYTPTEPEFEFIIENPYTSYEFKGYFGPYFLYEESSEAEVEYKLWSLHSYQDYYSLMQEVIDIDQNIMVEDEKNEIEAVGVKESDFEEHIVLALYYYSFNPASFGKLVKNANDSASSFVLHAETTQVVNKFANPIGPERRIAFVLIPRTELDGQSADKIDILFYNHIKDMTDTSTRIYSEVQHLTQSDNVAQ